MVVVLMGPPPWGVCRRHGKSAPAGRVVQHLNHADVCAVLPHRAGGRRLGERWTLLILRDMLVGSTRFNEISRGLPGLSRALLTRRLRQLQAAGLVERHDDGATP